jgi:hypothetical protein
MDWTDEGSKGMGFPAAKFCTFGSMIAGRLSGAKLSQLSSFQDYRGILEHSLCFLEAGLWYLVRSCGG